jgi:spore germination cell wall hydrolase CwlJ-like protein
MKPEHIEMFMALNNDEAAVLTIDGEAEGESAEGRQAVACVIENRADKWKKTIKEVCYQKNGFSCFISTQKVYPKMVEIAKDFPLALGVRRALQACAEAWRGDRSAVAAKLQGATFYRVVGTTNSWYDKEVTERRLILVCQIGHHEFHKEG